MIGAVKHLHSIRPRTPAASRGFSSGSSFFAAHNLGRSIKSSFGHGQKFRGCYHRPPVDHPEPERPALKGAMRDGEKSLRDDGRGSPLVDIGGQAISV
jgi:hypothetical protein